MILSNKDFLLLTNDFFEHSIWKEKRIFSKAEAWIDLNYMANESERREVGTSIRFLAARWKWSNGRVTRFFNLLKYFDMIKIRSNRSYTIIVILPNEKQSIEVPIYFKENKN
jgi:hypothetical protein